jgi:chlorite dismutase
MLSRLWTFCAGDVGPFEVVSVRAVCGEALPLTARLNVVNGDDDSANACTYRLRGVVSNERYLTGVEKRELTRVQQPLGRAPATLGVLIPIKKSDAWWDLPQDARRTLFEERSAHIALGRRALPNVARRLHHCRDLGTQEPFDFLTWFDFAPEDEPLFDDLLVRLRATEEWTYVVREVEVRVRR